jgi:hypothetical protein
MAPLSSPWILAPSATRSEGHGAGRPRLQVHVQGPRTVSVQWMLNFLKASADMDEPQTLLTGETAAFGAQYEHNPR